MSYSPLMGPVFLFVLACLFLWASVRSLRDTWNTVIELQRYEFHNRTGGGVVRFKTFEQALDHRQKKQSAEGALGLLVIFVIGSAWWSLYAGINLIEAL